MAWLFTEVGFFSVTRDPQGSGLQVRARVREDLDALRVRYLPTLTETRTTPDRDYPYRGYCTHLEMAAALFSLVLDIDYSNYKSRIALKQGKPRHDLYAQVWHVMVAAERKIEYMAAKLRTRTSNLKEMEEEINRLLKRSSSTRGY